VVDDSAVTRALIARTLRLAGVAAQDVFEADNGKAALEMLRETPFDLVLADLHMPVMDGVEMTRRILSDPATSAIPVMVISAEPSAQKIDELRRAGVRGYIRKPFTPEQIKAGIVEILRIGVTEPGRVAPSREVERSGISTQDPLARLEATRPVSPA
jgi:two-component system chemotaxis response regulator CheY